MKWRGKIEKLVKYHFDLDDMNKTRDEVINSLVDSLREEAKENTPEVTVNWREIAENWVDESFEQCWKECVEDNRQANDREDV